MEKRAIEQAADLLWRARVAGRRLEALPPECRPISIDDGYAIQDRQAAQAGQAVFGWKLAVTSDAGQRRLGIEEPLAGRLFEGFVLAEDDRLDAGSMTMRVAEPEFAFRLGRDLPPRASPYEMSEVVAAVRDLHLAIELPDARFSRHAEMGAADMVADDGFAGWFVLGPSVKDWRNLDLAVQPVRALRNGELASQGTSAATLGDPRRQLCWLARDRARRGAWLKAGDVVTTGTCCTPVKILPGDRVSAEFAALGKVEVRFD
jgi:2-keto-4-pentenoate hydratase